MISITIPGTEMFDNEKQEFVEVNPIEIELEHSLASLSKWESIFEKPFLGKDSKTPEETFGYIEAMLRTPNISSDILQRLSKKNLEDINKYIDAKMTATWFREEPNRSPSREIVTAELIYYWMVALNIPLECEHWHLTKLMTFIKVCNEKNQPDKKKMSRRDLAARNRELNRQRQQQYNTAG